MFGQLKKELPEIRPGDTIRIYQKVMEALNKDKDKDKAMPIGRQERLQFFEGVVIARKHGKGISATITVRNVVSGIGVEKIFPLHPPNIKKIEILRRAKTRRAKLYYLRKAVGAKARLKTKELAEPIVWEEKKPDQK